MRSLILGMLVLRTFPRIKICRNSDFKRVWHAIIDKIIQPLLTLAVLCNATMLLTLLDAILNWKRRQQTADRRQTSSPPAWKGKNFPSDLCSGRHISEEERGGPQIFGSNPGEMCFFHVRTIGGSLGGLWPGRGSVCWRRLGRGSPCHVSDRSAGPPRSS